MTFAPIWEIQKSDMNQMGNSTNPWQGDRKKVLCCCSAGLLRSPTTAALLNQKYGYNTRACGLEPEYALIPATQALVFWSDEIVVQNELQKAQVEHLIDSLSARAADQCRKKEIKVLGIDDSYEYMDDELQKLVLENYHVN